jgi:hypothetical protein
MRDLQRALDHISVIRTQLALGSQFRGYGPRSTAASGLLAMAVALGQSWWAQGRPIDPEAFIPVWVVTAIVCATLSCWEAVIRARRMHHGLSQEMVRIAVEQFLPAAVSGLLLTVIIVGGTSREEWMLPGLWEITFSLGVFASRQLLPRPVFFVGLWYLVAGLSCLALQAGSHELSPWAMGLPFGIGQLLAAVLLQHGYEDSLE